MKKKQSNYLEEVTNRFVQELRSICIIILSLVSKYNLFFKTCLTFIARYALLFNGFLAPLILTINLFAVIFSNICNYF